MACFFSTKLVFVFRNGLFFFRNGTDATPKFLREKKIAGRRPANFFLDRYGRTGFYDRKGLFYFEKVFFYLENSVVEIILLHILFLYFKISLFPQKAFLSFLSHVKC